MKRTIELSEETYQKIKGQLAEGEDIEINSVADMIGKKFFFRTVTYHSTGRVVKQIGAILELEDAAWIADSGRFSDALKGGKLSEVEPVGKMYLNMSTVVDFFPWNHPLPKEQK
ncbi:MAG: hypothetical protein GY841_12345 [FCB group bacterium]|nr:hypothetical protein [FCB group bacterium]